jgi:predicted nucleic acid-binding protein
VQVAIDTSVLVALLNPRLYLHVLDLIRATSGELNFNDALTALACRERSIPAIASFDPDFDLPAVEVAVNV